MPYSFVECNRDQQYLLPPSLKDWLPEGDLAWFIIDATSQMDLSDFYEKYRADGWGRPAFEPQMMVSLLLYSYCMGERSSRRIERLCERDIAYRIITANQVPDHTTIARFRQETSENLERLFAKVLKLCGQAGLVRVGVVALDGTKIEANASLAKSRTSASIEEQVKKMLKEAREVDEEEDHLYGPNRRGDESPAELCDRSSRLSRLKVLKERLERQAEEAEKAKEAKLKARATEEGTTGKRRRGRKPKSPQEARKEAEIKAKANITDPDSRIMKTRQGYIQGYNAQVVVTEDQIIVAAEVTVKENDVQELHPMLDKARANLDAAGTHTKIKKAVADAGYFSEANSTQENEDGPELFVATTKDWKQRQTLQDKPSPHGRIPANLSPREKMERKLLTKRGRATYKKRSQTVEPVFGQIKDARGCDRFMRRGEDAVGNEWKLVCATHNLLKLWRHLADAVKQVQYQTTANREVGSLAAA